MSRGAFNRTLLRGALLCLHAIAALALIGTAAAAVPAPGFQDEQVLTGLTNPTVFRFAPDGRLFVAEKSGQVKTYDNVSDPTPTIAVDVSTQVHNFWDRGLLGMAIDPGYPTRPYLYLLYTRDADISGLAPKWGTPGVLSDPCPTPPGATGDGCVVSGRLSRIPLGVTGVANGPEQPLVDGWCQQYPSHSMGSIVFGADGALYASAGDGASFTFADWGQDGNPLNPCGDPPTQPGVLLSPPTAEGGALRSQDLRTTGDPVGLNGTVIRVNPDTGNAMPDNPRAFSSDANERRIIAHGFRNPFRFTARPGTNDLWIGDVGWNEAEEIDRLPPTAGTTTVRNYGWPCYEGADRQEGYDGANLSLCENLYAAGAGAVTAPHFPMDHNDEVGTCAGQESGDSISGFAFYDGGNYPASFVGSLIFTDYSRECVWAIHPDANGVPDPNNITTLVTGADGPVDLQTGPNGDVFYLDFDNGALNRIRHLGANQAPTAVIQADPSSGAAPLEVSFDGSGSSDPEGEPLTYSWDLDGDGTFADSTFVAPSRTYTHGRYTVRLRVTDAGGATHTVSKVIDSTASTPPSATIVTPTASTAWKVGDTITFSGSGSDAEDGNLPPSALSWSLLLHHCTVPTSCHVHPVQDFVGVAGGTFTAPDHEYPSFLELKLTATDSTTVTDVESVQLQPQTVDLTFESNPAGLQLVMGPDSTATPFTKTVIVGSTHSVSAPTPQILSSQGYVFTSWSDGGAASHNIVAPATNTTLTAMYNASGGSAPGLVGAYAFNEGSGSSAGDVSGHLNNGTVENGAQWTGGKYGGALSFDGVNDDVRVPDDDSLDLTNGMTIEAWVRPATQNGWRTVIFKGQPAGLVYALYGNTSTNVPTAEAWIEGGARKATGTTQLPVDTWSHVAATYDGSVLRLYVNGTPAGSVPRTGGILSTAEPLWIGANPIWPEPFTGLIDEVRIYDRALAAEQIQADMNTPIDTGPPDTTSPTAPGTLTANGGLGTASLSWGAATDERGVTGYNVYRSTVASFIPSPVNRIAEVTGLSYTDTSPPGTYFYKVDAEDGAGNIGPTSNEASATVTADTTAPTGPTGLQANVSGTSAALTWAGSTDNVGVTNYNVHRGTSSGFTPTAANRIGQPVGTSYSDAGLAPGTYFYVVTAQDAALNVGAASNQATATVSTLPPPPSGLVAAYGFDEGSGTTVTDATGAGNTGAISGATFAPAGKFGGALDFDGVDDWVTIPDSNSLDLTTGMTLSAWVRPDVLQGRYRQVILKEQPGSLVYSLYAHTNRGWPSSSIYHDGRLRTYHATSALTVGTWSHLAVTYDGVSGAVRLYINGAVVGSEGRRGTILISEGALRIGGNSIHPEWFDGLIDNVRVFNRALPQSELQTEMTTPITPPDSQPPTVPTHLAATGGFSSVDLDWDASTDNVGVDHYNIYRSTAAGFVPNAANRIAQVTGTTYTDNSSPGTYFYKVDAQDEADNLSAASNEASATITGDTTAPSAPTELAASVTGNSALLTWTASSDNIGVARYNVHRGASPGFVPSPANRVAQPVGTSYTDAGLAAGTYYYVVIAEDAALNVSLPSNEASGTVTDGSPPTAPTGLAASVSGSSATLTWNAATDDVGVVLYNVHRSSTSGFTPTVANRIAQPTGTTFTDDGLSTGTYYYVVTARDAALNVGPPSNQASAVVPDTTAPTAPTNLAATGGLGSVTLSWTASSDDVGVEHYNVYRSTVAAFVPGPASKIAETLTPGYSNTGLAPGTYFYRVDAEDVAGNLSATSSEASGTATADTTPPTQPGSLTANPSGTSAALSWTPSTDNVGVLRYNVHRSTTSGFAPSAANRIAQPAGTSHSDSGLAPGTYHYRVIAEDAAGNFSAASNQASATVAPPLPDLVAAYGFDEETGTIAGDSSGNGNNGTVSGATRTTAGRFFGALSFDGVNDWVTVADSASLDLSTAMTLEAWVRPTAINAWRTVMFKEQAGNLVYGIYANTNTNTPAGELWTTGIRRVNGTAQAPVNQWTHLGVTYDGTAMRMYVNGTLASTLNTTGSILASNGVLHIGGNAVWPEWFSGLIDEVRIYKRALSQSEIQTDMNKSVGVPDTEAPTAPTNLAASGSVATAALTWTAATDNVAVHRYNVHRSTTQGFVPSDSNRVAQPTTTAYTDTGLGAGTYYYVVIAEDAAGNRGPTSNESSAAVTADTAPPSTPGTLNATGLPGAANLTWGAATDNVGVKHYNVHRSTLNGFTPSAANRVAQVTTGTSHSDSGVTPGTHYYRVIAEDVAGNLSTPSNQAQATVTAPSVQGLVAAYGFDEASGNTAIDSSGTGNNGTLGGPTRVPIGRFGHALRFDGANDWVTVPDSNSLDLSSGMTLEAWVQPTVVAGWRTVIFKEQTGNLVYGIYSNTNINLPAAEVYTGSIGRTNGTAQVPANQWTHLAATYDTTALRFYVNGTLVSTLNRTGAITASNGVLHIGGNAVWSEWFNGLIDEVRVYNRALSAAEVQSDMARGASNDTIAPNAVANTPADGAQDFNAFGTPTVTFDEAMDPATLTSSSFELRDELGALVPATVSYDAPTSVATLEPTARLAYEKTYTARVKGGPAGAKDFAGNSLAADRTWSFTTASAPPPILVLGAAGDGFSTYATEILRTEGLNLFDVKNLSATTVEILAEYDVALLGNIPLTGAQVTMLTNWVNSGGNLIAFRPDKQLAGLMGLTDAGTTLANQYFRVDTSAGKPGAGIVGETIQFHGTADRYTLNGASTLATLYSNATTATANPAVTQRSVGSNGGIAAAFTFDIARSIVYTRQGNPAWVGQDRDGVSPVRPNDLFFGNMAGNSQPDWVNVAKMNIPQADELQRFLVNLVLDAERDRKPLPRYWYFPRGEKAVVVMTGDDHADGGTAGRFDQHKAQSLPGCSVVQWECVRATSYIYPGSPLTNAQAAGYVADGFEVALHISISGGCSNWTPATLASRFATTLTEFAADYPSVPAPKTHRLHCVSWSDWATMPKTELANGMRLDTNYYHFPDFWIGANPGFMTGSGMPMRFADSDGTQIDVFMGHTHMNDEANQAYPFTIDSLLNGALGSNGYYGWFLANMHTDDAQSDGADAIVASAQSRGVPIISAKQMLDWVDARDRSTFASLVWSGNTLTFKVRPETAANGLEVLLPLQSRGGTLATLTRGGAAAAFTTVTVKGVQYASFPAVNATYVATYNP